MKIDYRIILGAVTLLLVSGTFTVSNCNDARWNIEKGLNPDLRFITVFHIPTMSTCIMTPNSESSNGYTRWFMTENTTKIYADSKAITAQWIVQSSNDGEKFLNVGKTSRADISYEENPLYLTVTRTTNYTRGVLEEIYTMPRDTESSMKFDVRFTPNTDNLNDQRYYQLTYKLSGTNLTANSEFWRNHTLILKDFQITWFNETDKVKDVKEVGTKDVYINFSKQWGGFTLDPTIRVGNTAIEYNKVENYCGRTTGKQGYVNDLLLNITLNKDLNVNPDKTINIETGSGLNQIYFEVCNNKTYTDKTTDCSTSSNQKTDINGTTYTYYNTTCTDTFVDKWRLEFDRADTFNFKANQSQVINLHGELKPQLKTNRVTILAKIGNIEVPI